MKLVNPKPLIAGFGNHHIMGMGLLGFSSGLPILLYFSTLSAWLRQINYSLESIGLLSLVSLPLSLKFLLSPFVDRIQFPWIKSMGKRKQWITITQIGIIISLGLLSLVGNISVITLSISALLLAFSSAFQDIAVDAYRIENFANENQGYATAYYVLGYRLAMLVSGAGVLFLVGSLSQTTPLPLSWTLAYASQGVLMCVIMLIQLLYIKERPIKPISHAKTSLRSLWNGLIDALTQFIQDYGVYGFILIILIVSTYRLPDLVGSTLYTPYYLDNHFTVTDIASISKLWGLFATLLGFGAVAFIVKILKPFYASLIGLILASLTNIFYISLMAYPGKLFMLAVVIGIDNFSAGIAQGAFIVFMTMLINTRFTAVQYAFLTSILILPAKLLGGVSGFLVHATGYAGFFIISAALGIIPFILLILYRITQKKSVIS